MTRCVQTEINSQQVIIKRIDRALTSSTAATLLSSNLFILEMNFCGLLIHWHVFLTASLLPWHTLRMMSSHHTHVDTECQCSNQRTHTESLFRGYSRRKKVKDPRLWGMKCENVQRAAAEYLYHLNSPKFPRRSPEKRSVAPKKLCLRRVSGCFRDLLIVFCLAEKLVLKVRSISHRYGESKSILNN